MSDERLERLERKLTRQKRLTLVLVVAVGVGVLGAAERVRPDAPAPDVITARKIRVVDADGKVVVEAWASEDGDGGLSVKSRSGMSVFSVSTDNGGGERVVERFPSGQKSAEGHMLENGDRVAAWTMWHANGKKRAAGRYENGKENGRWVTWHENGHKESEGDWVDGSHSGRWTYFWDNGQKKAEVESRGGRGVTRGQRGHQEGPATYWHRNGKKSAEGEWRKGLREGTWTYWHPDGSIDDSYSGIWKAGRRIAALPDKK